MLLFFICDDKLSRSPSVFNRQSLKWKYRSLCLSFHCLLFASFRFNCAKLVSSSPLVLLSLPRFYASLVSTRYSSSFDGEVLRCRFLMIRLFFASAVAKERSTDWPASKKAAFGILRELNNEKCCFADVSIDYLLALVSSSRDCYFYISTCRAPLSYLCILRTNLQRESLSYKCDPKSPISCLFSISYQPRWSFLTTDAFLAPI